MSTPLGVVLEAALPLLGAVGLLVAGYVVWGERYVYGDVDITRVVGWTVVGMVGMTVIFLWILSHQFIRGGRFHHAQFILVNNIVVGSLIGFVVGTYDARSRAYQRAVHEERLKHDFLHRQLRHHILNRMQMILDRADRLVQRADSSEGDLAATIKRQGETIVDRVESVRLIAQSFAGTDAAPLDDRTVSGTLRDAVDRVDAEYDEAVVSTDIPDGIFVRADQFFPILFENLLTNAVEYNDKETPRVRVTLTVDEETAVVRVADNGSGISEERPDSVFEWDSESETETEIGVGLAMVNVLVDRYGGDLELQHNEPTGTVARVELSRVTDPEPSDSPDTTEATAASDEPELATAPEKVTELLTARGGRVPQSDVAEELDWSQSKTSRVISDMVEEGTVEKLRLGRQNLIELADSE